MQGIFILFLFLIFCPFSMAHAIEPNAGFVKGLWYGKEKIYAEETVRIYIAIRNYTESDLTGTVEFFDGDKRIERKSVTALDGRIIESWADWTPSYGTHSLKATLSRIELSKVGSTTQEVTVTSSLAEDTVFVDHDTDNDTIGNEIDEDDDGDSITDAQEKEDGTNPLVKEKVTQTQNSSNGANDSNGKATDNSTSNNDSASNNIDAHSSSNNQSNGRSSNAPQGLEQYLAPSPALTALGTVTNYITQTKTNLDTYRTNRTEDIANAKASSTKETVNNDGFGEVTRTNEDDANKVPLPEIEGDSFFDKLFTIIGTVTSKLYTWILNTLSFILAHPMFIQLALLLLILFGMIKLASKFGRRPSFKKAK